MGTSLKILSTPQEHRVRTSTNRGVLLLNIVNIAGVSVQRSRKGLEVIVKKNERLVRRSVRFVYEDSKK